MKSSKDSAKTPQTRNAAILKDSVYGGRISSLGTRGSMPVVHGSDSPLNRYRSTNSWVGKSRDYNSR